MPLSPTGKNFVLKTAYIDSGTTFYLGLTNTILSDTSTMVDVYDGEPVSNPDYQRIELTGAITVDTVDNEVLFPGDFKAVTVNLGPVSAVFLTDSISGSSGVLHAYWNFGVPNQTAAIGSSFSGASGIKL